MENDKKQKIEVEQKPIRRKLTKKYKLSILEQAECCTERGQLGLLLRQEGLYSSQLTKWRRLRDDGTLGNPRGRKAKQSVAEKKLEKLQKKYAKLEKQLENAELIIDIQKKLSQVLGLPLRRLEDESE